MLVFVIHCCVYFAAQVLKIVYMLSTYCYVLTHFFNQVIEEAVNENHCCVYEFAQAAL